ncbi:MAG TPA: diguanylate cyclase [Candidatus Angelobacter sp.]|nr:diguanylate cyclase [Candidatus Angelobacter sp.]
MPRIRALSLVVLQLALLYAAAQGLFAQSLPLPEHPRFVFQKLPENLGLSTATVTCLAQDPMGFLWIGTQFGLYRYDGVDVVQFTAEQGLGNFRILQLLVSPRGDLWVVSDQDIWRYKQGRFTKFPMPSGYKVSGGFQVIAVNADNMIWVLTDENPLLEINADHPEIFTVSPAKRVVMISRAPDDSILVGVSITATQWRVGRIPKGSSEVELFPADTPGTLVYGLVSDGHDVWARTIQHFSRWDGEQKRWVPDDAGLPGASDLGNPTVTREGDIIMPTVQGLYRHSHGHWERTGMREGMETNTLFAALEDRDGGIWLGFGGNGVERWPGPNEWMGWSQTEGLPDSVVWATVRDQKQRLWVGTNTGLGMWDPSLHKWRTWKAKDGLPGELLHLYITPEGTLWMLSLPTRSLYWIDLQTLSLHRIKMPVRKDSIGYDSIFPGPGGTLWASNEKYIDQYKNVNGVITRNSISVPDTAKQATTELRITPEGVVWGSGPRGISRFDGKQWQLITTQDGLLSDPVAQMGGATADEIWISNFSASGVTRIHMNQDGHPRLRVYTTADGLASNSIYLIARDHSDNIWLGGDRGLSVLHPDGTISDQARDSGLLWNDVMSGSFYEDADGGIFIGTSRGLAYRRPNIPLAKSMPKETVITSASFADKEMLSAHHPSISYRDATFEAHFSVAAIDTPAGQSCKYQLQGLESDPVKTTLRQVRYTALPAGDYTFTVNCGCATRGWSTPATWSFTIRPPWWQRLWTRIAMVLLLLFAITWTTRTRTHALENQRQRLEEAVAARSAELQAANKRLEEASLRDPLTGIGNRRFFELTIPRDVQQTIRAYQTANPHEPPRDRDLVFFIMDIDHFKNLNDTYGHAAGDEVLVAMARRLAGIIRESDVLVRWGGEEFLIVSQSTSPAAAQHVASRILAVIGGLPFETSDGLSISKTCSVGWAVFPWIGKAPADVSVDDILKLADRALYMAKQGGRNRAIGLYPDKSMQDGPIDQQKAKPRVVEIHGPVPSVEHQS